MDGSTQKVMHGKRVFNFRNCLPQQQQADMANIQSE
jgi:hypothetical protein